MQGFCAFWLHCSDDFMNFLFFFTMVLTVDSFILKWRALVVADLNLWCISSNSTFSCNVMTFLCFLGALPASLVALRMGPMVLFKVYGTALNIMKNTQKQERSLFTAICNLLERETVHAEMIGVTRHSKWILTTLELTTIAIGCGYEIIVVIQYVLQLILCSYALILRLYICLHFPQLRMAPCTVCVCVPKLW